MLTPMHAVFIDYEKMSNDKQKASRTLHALALDDELLPADFAD